MTYRGWGIAFAFIGVLAFSVRPILIKLSYAAHPVSPSTLLFLRMTLALPFFCEDLEANILGEDDAPKFVDVLE